MRNEDKSMQDVIYDIRYIKLMEKRIAPSQDQK